MRTLLVAAVLSVAVSATALAQEAQAPAPLYPFPPPEPAVVTTPGGRDVLAPVSTDRSTRCLMYGSSIGVPADKISDYVKRCALQ